MPSKDAQPPVSAAADVARVDVPPQPGDPQDAAARDPKAAASPPAADNGPSADTRAKVPSDEAQAAAFDEIKKALSKEEKEQFASDGLVAGSTGSVRHPSCSGEG